MYNRHTALLPRRADHRRRHLIVALLVPLWLAACGGGGGGGGDNNSSSTPLTPTQPTPSEPTPPSPDELPDNTFGVDCSGSNCGALNATTYAGSGIGLWRYDNTSATPAIVPVSLSGTAGRSVTLVMTHLGDASASPGGIAGPGPSSNLLSAPINATSTETVQPPENHIPDHVRRFRPQALERNTDSIARSVSSRNTAAQSSVVGDSKTWYSEDDSVRLATLEMQRTASDGRVVNFWVENGEYGGSGVSSSQLETLANAFASGSGSVYARVTNLAGQPWGAHPYSNLIAPSQQLDIVLLNLTPDNEAFGLVGYFWGRNNFLRTSEINSNESLSFYLDTETLYLGGNDGLQFEISTLAHEMVHMINFYQRAVVRSTQNDYTFDTWLEEMSALMMEDIVGLTLDTTFHTIRDDRFPKWLNSGDFNCDVTVFDDNVDSPCFGYNLTGSLGAWLLRHYGIDFYKALLTNTSSTDSIALLDDTIRDHGGAGFKDAVRRWGTLLALLPAASSPTLFGLPARSDQGYTLPAIDGAAYVHVRRLPLVAPTQLETHGHFPQLRSNVADPYVETVTVPAFTTLTVIVK